MVHLYYFGIHYSFYFFHFFEHLSLHQYAFRTRVNQRRFYAFMASNKLPWDKLWRTLWSMIPDPLSDGRLLVALDDFINPKTGRNIFGCSSVFDHAAKANQSKYPWAQNVVLVGLLKRIKGRWACLPLAHRFYLPKKAVEAKSDNMKIPGNEFPFQTKLDQAVEMLIQLAHHFAGVPLTVVCDSWFGNNGLFKPLRKHLGNSVHLLSRLRSNSVLYTMPENTTSKKRGRPRKYGRRLGSCAEMAAKFISHASIHRVFLYGKHRDVNAFSKTVMLKTLKCPVRVVWVFEKHSGLLSSLRTWIYLLNKSLSTMAPDGKSSQVSRKSSRTSAAAKVKPAMHMP